MPTGNFWTTLPGILTAVAAVITAVTGLVVALTRNRRGENAGPVPATPQTPDAPERGRAANAPAPDASGAWKAHVTYSWGATHAERLVFQVDGERLTGTVTYLGVPRGINGGMVRGDHIAFTIRAEELIGAEVRPYQLSYSGTAVGGGLHFRLEDSRGTPAVQFAAARELPSP